MTRIPVRNDKSEIPIGHADPKLFLFTRTLGNVRYGGQVACRNWDDAREWCRKAGVELDGEHVMTVTGIGAGLYVRAITRLRNWWRRPT